MVWPVAALVVVLVGFALVYGSLVQSRFERARDRAE
jgi:CBS-domain-containing membrane protein